MPDQPAYAPFAASDMDRFLLLFRHAFASTANGTRHYVETVAPENFRVMRRNGAAVAGLGMLDMKQYFGGRGVPCRGISAVMVEPGERGRGTGSRMMAAMLEETRAAGFPISTLYPATRPLYAKVGYASAGDRITYRLPFGVMRGLRPDPSPELMTSAVRSTLEVMQAQRALRTNGLLARCELLWQRALDSAAKPLDTWLIPGADGPEGYVTMGPKSPDRTLHVEDWAALTPRAGKAILGFLAGWHSQAQAVTWAGGPEDMLIRLMPEVGATIASWEQWMLRVTDVAGALTARGWPTGVRAGLTFDVTDPLLSDNGGRYRLEVDDGKASVERLGGSGNADIALGVDALATLYTGHLAPRTMADLELLQASEPALDTAASLFAGPKPWLSDMF
ncbi:MAG TPA: GNAT family N-acetyltransferase [Skermanella sp.]|jgi:predicted acetyltransferase|nr:GNAT family N-acetyltransferase [Skermanella sp.]